MKDEEKYLEDEMEKFGERWPYPASFDGYDKDWVDELTEECAKHFYELGKQSGSSEIPKDLESYAQKVEDHYDVGEERGYLCVHRGGVKDAVIAGAQWHKEQMMKVAVEGEIQMRYSGCLCAKTIRAINEDKFNLGDKVRIIIVKEDKK